MKNKTVILMIGTKKKINPEVSWAIEGFGCELVHFVAPRIEGLHVQPERNRCINIANARNIARKMGLTKNASHYLWIDDDIVPPPNAIHSLISHKKPAMGGWFKMDGGAAWAGGRYVADHTFQHYMFPERSVVKTDLLSMGCALLRRDILQAFEFGSGIDKFVKLAANGAVCHIADSGDFSNKLLDSGIQPYLDGDVICNHLCN